MPPYLYVLQIIANFLAITLGPVTAVVITLCYQRRKEKRDAQMRLFITLMAYRKSYPISYEWAQSLNLIDTVFSTVPKVVERWRQFYSFLQRQNPSQTELADQHHKYLELMSEMAKYLDFPNLQQTDIDRFYIPIAHGDQAALNYKIQTEWLRVLENTASLVVKKKEDDNPQQPPSEIHQKK